MLRRCLAAVVAALRWGAIAWRCSIAALPRWVNLHKTLLGCPAMLHCCLAALGWCLAEHPNAAIEIADYGAAPQLVAGMAAWRLAPVNIQNDEGYQRTVKFNDYPAFETYTKDGDARQMIILVADRFLVTVQTNHVSEADLKTLAESIPLEELANLR